MLGACGDSEPGARSTAPRVVVAARGTGPSSADPASPPPVAAETAGRVPVAVVWEPREVGSAGGGAAAAAEVGEGGGVVASLERLRAIPDGALDEAGKAALQEILVPQPDPRQSIDLELALLHKGIYLREAPLYDGAWRHADRPKNWSEERLRERARQWDRPYEVMIEGGKAVAFYRDAPELAPIFVRRKNPGWMIDASRTAALIVYDDAHRTWYALDQGSPYLALLARALPLRRVVLPDGRGAWQLDPAGPTE
jgi:hypothetical protein